MFFYELSGCGFEYSCSHLNFRFRACFEQGVPWPSGNYRVWIHSKTRTWHDKNIQSLQQLFVFGDFLAGLFQLFKEIAWRLILDWIPLPQLLMLMLKARVIQYGWPSFALDTPFCKSIVLSSPLHFLRGRLLSFSCAYVVSITYFPQKPEFYSSLEPLDSLSARQWCYNFT